MEKANIANRTSRLSKRRKLNIDNVIQSDIGGPLNTPQSQRVGDWADGSARSASIIDLTGEDDSATTSANLDFLQEPSGELSEYELSGDEKPGDETSEDESAICRSHTAIDDQSSARELKYVQIPRATLATSAFSGWYPPEGSRSELGVLSDDFDRKVTQYFELDDFTVYRPQTDSKRSMEMSTLDRLQSYKGPTTFCFDGRLSTATGSYYVHGVTFSTVAVDGYGDVECVDLFDKICIQSPWAKSHNVWYRLGRPSAEYRVFYEDFTWLATFTKYFIDFLLERETSVTLHLFRSEFAPWIIHQYGQSTQFQAWHQKCGYQQDFGTSVAAFVNYLHKECYSIDGDTPNLLQHPLWSEIDPEKLNAIERQPTNVSGATVVTPFAFRCFQDMYFAAHLKRQDPTPEVQAQISVRKHDMCLTPWNAAPVPRPCSAADVTEPETLMIKQGDVICTDPNTGDAWKRSKSERWYAYVTGLRDDRNGRTTLDVLWLYEPADTTLGNAFYPFENELFLSDNCSCGKHGIPIEAVIAKVDVAWFVHDPHAANGYFVRQKFQTVEADDSYGFVTLTSKDFSCRGSHLSDFELCQEYYKVGQAVLVRPGKSDTNTPLQPMRIIRFDMDKRRVVLRNFNRAVKHNPTAPLNELLETSQDTILTASHVIRTCEIGRFSTREEVVLPFNRNGLGDYYYVLEISDKCSTQETLQTPPDSDCDSDHKGVTGEIPFSPLVGLDLYCGGGNFGRGLEEFGIVKMRYAVDWVDSALHSYRANVEKPDSVHYFLGSVNDYLRGLLCGSTNPDGSPCPEIARIGSIDFASAGSPCPGFSKMQQNKRSDQSLQFASMVASVVAFVDTYSPQYFILENVVDMTSKIVVNGQAQNVFSQILASLVALGYQVQQFLGDAWSLGSSQSRSRVFIVASAPGTVPLYPPPSTHGHPPGKGIKRNLGRTTNGLPFGIRRWENTPFPYVSARSATNDLPDIGDSLTQICPRFPDHRTHADQSFITRQRLMRVPTLPHGTGLAQAARSGRIRSGEAYGWVQKQKRDSPRGIDASKSYTRIKPDGLFPTILTDLHLQCGINGKTLHWEQHRSMSIMETRRAQGFLDHEVIVGSPSQQLKIVGNSVDRKVAFAMGLVIKKSWSSTIKLKRDLLRGNASAIVAEEEQEVADHDQDSSHALLSPSPTQIESAKLELSKMRTESFTRILQKLQYNRREQPGQFSQDVAVQPGFQRWSGASPADAVAIRDLEDELETVLPLHGGCPSSDDADGGGDDDDVAMNGGMLQ
jgi:DNA (cytosine-5)-methyltransferase 1